MSWSRRFSSPTRRSSSSSTSQACPSSSPGSNDARRSFRFVPAIFPFFICCAPLILHLFLSRPFSVETRAAPLSPTSSLTASTRPANCPSRSHASSRTARAARRWATRPTPSTARGSPSATGTSIDLEGRAAPSRSGESLSRRVLEASSC